jgi:hypothetical protein
MILRCLYDNFVSTLFNGYLLYQYLHLWFSINPDPIIVETLAVLICFEFIMVHSAVFMAVFQKKLSILFFVLVYALFAYEFNKMLPLQDNKIMIAYFTVVLQMRFAFYNISEKQHDKLLGFSGLAAIIYILSIGFCIVFSNFLPKLICTNAFLNENNFHHNGFDLSKHSTLITTGSIYYSLLIFSILYNAYLEKYHGN